MTRREWIALASAAVLQGQDEPLSGNESAALDLMYQALELLSQNAPAKEVESAVELLGHALDQNPSLGDAYYYRQLCWSRLKKYADRRKRDSDSATLNHSEAQSYQRDPFTLAVPQLHGDLGSMGQKFALVVGITKFKDDDVQLPAAAADARDFADALLDPTVGRFSRKNVTLLTNQQATTVAIKAAMNHIAGLAKPEDAVVVYFATHGSPRSDDLRQVSYLSTYDTAVGKQDLVFATALPMVEVSGILSTRCRAQRTVAIFDTCHSGVAGMDAGQALVAEDMNRLKEGAGRYIISSCQADQQAYELNRKGIFTASLVKALRARGGCISLTDLFKTVKDDVEAVAKAHKLEQSPVMVTSVDSDEIVLGTAPGKTQCG